MKQKGEMENDRFWEVRVLEFHHGVTIDEAAAMACQVADQRQCVVKFSFALPDFEERVDFRAAPGSVACDVIQHGRAAAHLKEESGLWNEG